MNIYRETFEGSLGGPIRAKSLETLLKRKGVREFLHECLLEESDKWGQNTNNTGPFPEAKRREALQQWYIDNLEVLDEKTGGWKRA